MKYSVVREIHFSYGHRLLNHPGKCVRLHGHNGRVAVEVESSALDGQGMVIDFHEISKKIGAWIDEVLDHKMILCAADPLVPLLQKAGEPLVITQENPTAEVLARWIYDEARKMNLPVARIVLWETPDSAASFGCSGHS